MRTALNIYASLWIELKRMSEFVEIVSLLCVWRQIQLSKLNMILVKLMQILCWVSIGFPCLLDFFSLWINVTSCRNKQSKRTRKARLRSCKHRCVTSRIIFHREKFQTPAHKSRWVGAKKKKSVVRLRELREFWKYWHCSSQLASITCHLPFILIVLEGCTEYCYRLLRATFRRIRRKCPSFLDAKAYWIRGIIINARVFPQDHVPFCPLLRA